MVEVKHKLLNSDQTIKHRVTNKDRTVTLIDLKGLDIKNSNMLVQTTI